TTTTSTTEPSTTTSTTELPTTTTTSTEPSTTTTSTTEPPSTTTEEPVIPAELTTTTTTPKTCKDHSDCHDNSFLPFCNENEDGIKVCGDPHIRLYINGAKRKYPICFEFVGKMDHSYLFVKDGNLEIRSTFGHEEIHKRDNGVVNYFSKMWIRKGRTQLHIDPNSIMLEDNGKQAIFPWTGSGVSSIQLHDGKLKLKRGNDLYVFFEDEAFLIIISKGTIRRKVDMLSFSFTKKTGLSPNADGIMGAFAKKAQLLPGEFAKKRHEVHGQHYENSHGTVNIGTYDLQVHFSNKCWRINTESRDDFHKILDEFEIPR
ncbi:unnamed protein product, partial [Owenia fusiformis]